MSKNGSHLDRIREIALEQLGFVTTAQAKELGVKPAALAMLVKRDRLEHVSYGLYRVPLMPVTQYDPLMQAVLWTGVPEAVLSHETALAAYEVSDINPFHIDLTVNAGRRIKRAGGEAYRLHFENLEPSQITWFQQIPIVTLATAIRQCIKLGVPTYLLRQAIENGQRTGNILKNKAQELTELLEMRNNA